MEVPLRKRNVYRIASSAEYIVALGYGITIWKRSTFELVHQFTGIRHIHGGFFLNGDVLVVFTGEQRLYFSRFPKNDSYGNVPAPGSLRRWEICNAVKYPVQTRLPVSQQASRASKNIFSY